VESRADPSRWSERLALAALAAVGLAISLYLTAFQLGLVARPWDPLFGPVSSARVLHSALSRALPVPDALLGAAAYAAEIATGLAGGAARWRTHPLLVLAFGAIAAGLGVAGVALVAVQALVVRAGCTPCLCSAALSITIALEVAGGGEIAAAWRVLRQGRERRRAG
jgi:uncharacterized membrane protein